ncbi:MAG: hypothetical protein LJF30_07310 [Acidobacteria bacterium]|nr:hypothetical protein [Acidobacteriota bacterium]
MPELPEVEAARRRAERQLVGRHLAAVSVAPDPIVFEGTSPRRLVALRGREVVAVRRRGKHLWMELDKRPHLLFHFGMAGGFRLGRAGEPRPRFWKLDLTAEDNRRLVFTDPRRLGRVRLRRNPEGEAPLAGLGFDVLEDLPPTPKIVEIFARHGAPVKAVLLDQSLFAGVGNWIADEVLYQAGLDPRRPASSLSREEVGRLRSRLHDIVRRAVAVDADSARFPRTWLFHRRWGRKPGAHTARGEPITFLTVGGRTTAWVPSRQG